MSNVIAIINQKGGVGKTTTTINLGASLAVAERKTLIIDLDPQGNATSGLGVNAGENPENTIYQALIGQCDLKSTIRPTELPDLYVVPADKNLSGAEVELVTAIAREQKLKNAIAALRNEYHYILIDCPPSLGLLTINALTAADSYLVPMQCEYFALEGLSQLLHTANLIQQALNPALKQEGILLTMFDARNSLTHQVTEEVRKHFGDKVFKTVIPRNVRLSEAPSHGKPIILYDIESKGSASYLAVAKEIIEKQAAKRPQAQINNNNLQAEVRA
jgi:chromosome partitioning protein